MLTNNRSAQEYWLNHIEQWQDSGLTQAAYCRQYELTIHKFSYWKCKLNSNGETNAGFVQVNIAQQLEPLSATGLCIEFTDGIRLAGINQVNAALAQQLVTVLR